MLCCDLLRRFFRLCHQKLEVPPRSDDCCEILRQPLGCSISTEIFVLLKTPLWIALKATYGRLSPIRQQCRGANDCRDVLIWPQRGVLKPTAIHSPIPYFDSSFLSSTFTSLARYQLGAIHRYSQRKTGTAIEVLHLVHSQSVHPLFYILQASRPGM